MVAVITGTNRTGSRTRIAANAIIELLKAKNVDASLIDLAELDSDWFGPSMYTESGQANFVQKIQDEVIIPADKFIFIAPEYNGSIPGVLKMFLDALSIRELKGTFNGKKAYLMGVAMGRAGNLRGLEHLTAILMHLGVNVYPNRLPISQVHTFISDDRLSDEGTIELIQAQLDAFMNW